MRARIALHLINGETLLGDWGDITDDDAHAFKVSVTDILSSEGGYQLNLILPGGKWVSAPKGSILYVAIEEAQENE